jgi:hypothetical protein
MIGTSLESLGMAMIGDTGNAFSERLKQWVSLRLVIFSLLHRSGWNDKTGENDEQADNQ